MDLAREVKDKNGGMKIDPSKEKFPYLPSPLELLALLWKWR